MPISIEADPTLAQGYIKVNGTTAATISTAGIVSGGIPAGAVMPFAMNSAPSGWLAADGTAVSRTTYASLFAAISTTHGAGNGSTTFNLPDLRGIFVRGSGTQTVSGRTYTIPFATKQLDAIRTHSHTGGFIAAAVPASGGTATGWTGSLSQNTGATGDDETRPVNLPLLYCIKH